VKGIERGTTEITGLKWSLSSDRRRKISIKLVSIEGGQIAVYASSLYP
jgi:hypothetical protein